ncbi:MAG: PfkB family carbohydrate kinase [Actinomycetota bacterium]
MLCVIGDLVEDVVVWLPQKLSYGTDTPAKIVRTRGGSAANVAVFAAAISSPDRPGSRLIAQVGDDDLGERLVAELVDADVDPCVVRSGRTGSIVVIVSPDGERTMITDRAAAIELADAPVGWSTGVSILHVPAYSLFSGSNQCGQQASNRRGKEMQNLRFDRRFFGLVDQRFWRETISRHDHRVAT